MINPILTLFSSPLVFMNVGPAVFTNALERQQATVIQVDWKPPAGGDKNMQEILKLLGEY
ncbi:fdrA domain protein [Oscillospiraceae bacterium MB08-C2-2]|nr:fdrA domain protein [Oscillospiraceae bacterium MB08-C2-2]